MEELIGTNTSLASKLNNTGSLIAAQYMQYDVVGLQQQLLENNGFIADLQTKVKSLQIQLKMSEHQFMIKCEELDIERQETHFPYSVIWLQSAVEQYLSNEDVNIFEQVKGDDSIIQTASLMRQLISHILQNSQQLCERRTAQLKDQENENIEIIAYLYEQAALQQGELARLQAENNILRQSHPIPQANTQQTDASDPQDIMNVVLQLQPKLDEAKNRSVQFAEIQNTQISHNVGPQIDQLMQHLELPEQDLLKEVEAEIIKLQDELVSSLAQVRELTQQLRSGDALVKKARIFDKRINTLTRLATDLANRRPVETASSSDFGSTVTKIIETLVKLQLKAELLTKQLSPAEIQVIQALFKLMKQDFTSFFKIDFSQVSKLFNDIEAVLCPKQ